MSVLAVFAVIYVCGAAWMAFALCDLERFRLLDDDNPEALLFGKVALVLLWPLAVIAFVVQQKGKVDE